ncbi:MAG TPA: AAA family ATPase, partial [Anaerolineales bacterium]|nr:AAA family ATPase [Anaerolineales bacterium]
LGVEPSEQTRSLFAQLVRGDRPAVATAAPSGGRATTEGARVTARQAIEAEGAVESRTTMPIVDWLRSGRSPLVGRDRELARAKTLWQHARDGEGKVLVISGEPGIGKSRLTQEVMTWVSANGGRVLLGECHAEGSAPYAPLAQILGQVFAGDGRATARRLHLSSLILADAVKLAPSLRSILGDLPPNAALEPESELFRLYEAVALICAAVSRETPTLWVVEDVHWADSGTLGVVRHLARRARPGVPGAGLRLLMVLTHRDAETALAQMPEAVLSDFASERLAETLPLNRLSSEQTAELVAGWLGPKVSPDLVASIHFQAEGNPFFTEEICKAITAEPDQQQTSMGRMNIPHSVRSMVLARVERLPKPVQETLRWAALLGREFDSDTLSAVSGMDEGALTEVLELAGRAQLVSEVREPAMGGDGLRFAFTHALIPLALVESLGTLRQRRWHRRAAETVERLRPDDVEALAYHYVRAADRTKAIAYAHRAAKKAESLYAYDEAIRHLDTAAALLSSEHPAGLRLGLLEERADIHWLRYDWAAALESYRAALELCSSSTEEDESVRVRLNRKMLEMAADWSAASIRARKGDAAGVARPARAALMSWHGRESAAAALLAEKIRVLIALARDALFTRLPPDWQAGADYAWTAVELAESSGATDVLPVALHTLAQAQAANSEFRAAVETATHQLALARMEGDRNPRALLNGLLDAGVAHLNVGEFEEALVHLDSAVGLSTRIHDIAAYRYGLTRKAFCLLLLDRWEPLLELEAPLEDLRRRFPAARTGAVCFGLAFCGSARAWRGEKQHAADLRQDAYDIMVELHGPPELWDQGHHY